MMQIDTVGLKDALLLPQIHEKEDANPDFDDLEQQMNSIRESSNGFYQKSPKNREQSVQVISTPSILDTAAD